MKKNYLPIFVKSQRVLLIGGGKIAFNKYQILRNSISKIKVIALEICPQFLALLNADKDKIKLSFETRGYQNSDLNYCDLVVSAMNNKEHNQALYKKAIKKEKLINCVDDVQFCNFIFPAIIDKDGVLIAISTAGKSPVLASWLKSKILQSFPQNFAKLSTLVFQQRKWVREKIHVKKAQVRFWHQLFNHFQNKDTLWNITGQIKRFNKIDKVNQFNKTSPSLMNRIAYNPKVYLVGAGPGSSDLLTLKAARLLAQADVVLYDGLVSNDVLFHIRKEAIKIDVSKRRGIKKITQQQINQLLIDYAQQFQMVIRLKSGDPMIFSRGSEEIFALKNANIKTQIIPGISAIQAASANHQFALTHREYAKGLQLHSLHDLPSKNTQFFNNLAHSNDTFAFYMATEQLNELVARLLDLGVNPNLGIALIENISYCYERIFVGTISNIEQKIPEVLAKPCLIVLGNTINQNLNQSLNQAINQTINQDELSGYGNKKIA